MHMRKLTPLELGYDIFIVVLSRLPNKLHIRGGGKHDVFATSVFLVPGTEAGIQNLKNYVLNISEWIPNSEDETRE